MAGIAERVNEFLKSWSMNDRIHALKAERMVQGEKKHGPLDLWNDPRNFIVEGVED